MPTISTFIRNHLNLPALLCLCCLGSTPLLAQDTDGNLVPGDSDDFVILAELLTGETPTVAVGDKVFSMFSYTPAGDMPDAADINVFGFQDNDGNYGLSLHGVFWDLPGDEIASAATLEFDVTVGDQAQQQGFRISDAHLFLNGASIDPNSVVSVDESFDSAPETLRVALSSLQGQPENTQFDFVDFSDLYPSLRTTAVIFASAGPGSTQPARTTAIDLTFSQTIIPEPSSALLILMAGSTLAIFRCRRSLIVG